MTATPHDALFKAVFSDPQNAAPCLAEFLPGQIVEALDLNRAEEASGDFVDEDLTERHTDLVYRVPIRDDDRERSTTQPREILLYVLFEHQSTVDPFMAFRILRYMVRIWEKWLATTAGDHIHGLPPILPLVLYTGERKWTAPRQFFDLLNLPRILTHSLRAHCPDFRFWLESLARRPDRNIPGRGLGRLTLLVMRNIRRPDFAQRVRDWENEFLLVIRGPEGGLDRIGQIEHYIKTSRGGGKDEEMAQVQKYIQELMNCTPEPGSLADKWLNEGRAEGRAKGHAEASATILRRQLQLKFGDIPSWADERIAGATVDQLQSWADRVITSNAVGEVFER